ncbi:MAG: SURF1 family protein [Nocardioides sp.]
MRTLRLVSRRWAMFAVVVALLVYLAWWLGQWQFHRLEDRRARNATTVANEQAAPVPVDRVLAVGEPVPETDEWRLVEARGTYDPGGTVIVRYQSRDGASGVDVVVPLVTASGAAVLVDRGWLASENSAALPEVPPPPAGEVTVTGWVRVDGTGSSTKVTDRSTRAISSEAIGPALDRAVYGGFVDLKSEDPAPSQPLTRAELPDLGEGPHFFYGLQWWFFGALAVFGFFYLAYDEWRGQGRPAALRRGSTRANRLRQRRRG